MLHKNNITDNPTFTAGDYVLIQTTLAPKNGPKKWLIMTHIYV